MTDTDEEVLLFDLDALWPESAGEPETLFESEDPPVQSGSYVIEPGERVPETGTTSHGGPELSVILSGEIVLGTPQSEGDTEEAVPAGTYSVIPTGVEHYSENRGDEPVELVYTVAGEL
jgi:oxalate decarboxylase/phosphoglucose isomerase-like protein (cupin superfamily)